MDYRTDKKTSYNSMSITYQDLVTQQMTSHMPSAVITIYIYRV